ncbi:hypothetical protein TanjilG_02253 [Lupinus angustifolius]|uniref:Serine-threonine/tyrosine-protein kinase catalytic domain-containing protein n=1 Tax=Lupinus angustifolius TaxID=3871 RepID=A0A4P1QQF9_LUPAN|nr:hypothetical protein TanjilG_02253 [Lupinus angustifolius]
MVVSTSIGKHDVEYASVFRVDSRFFMRKGYLAPEYAIRGKLTRKADIYSFGVLLMEIISGRCNINSRLPIEEQFLLERAWDHYERKELVRLVDTSLNEEFDPDQASKFLKISLLCTQESPASAIDVICGKNA